MPPPPEVLQLIERFTAHPEAFLSVGYGESQARPEFIEPLFRALGWDTENSRKLEEPFREVLREIPTRMGGTVKTPDYSFRLEGRRRFFVEVQKPAVRIGEAVDPAYQLRRYAWSAAMPIALLTDFEEFAVYDCRERPAPWQDPATGRLLYFRYTELAERWEQFSAVFGRDNVRQGSLDRYAAAGSSLPLRTIEGALLAELERWRGTLARGLARENPGLAGPALDSTARRLVNRLLFLRIAEDEGWEPYGRLGGLLKGNTIYARLCDLFRRADARYGGGLFRAGAEEGALDPALVLDDRPLRDLLEGVYFPASPFEFSVLPFDLVAGVYEQFLPAEGRPPLSPESTACTVRHAVTARLAGHTPREVERLQVLDPVCRAGPLLAAAYQALLAWHLAEYRADKTRSYADRFHQGARGLWHLTLAERRRILGRNLLGADPDPRAVEAARLFLALRLLAGEADHSLEDHVLRTGDVVLPDLEKTIRVGDPKRGEKGADVVLGRTAGGDRMALESAVRDALAQARPGGWAGLAMVSGGAAEAPGDVDGATVEALGCEGETMIRAVKQDR